MKKINNEISKFSYVNERTLKDNQYSFQEICQDLIYREYNYMHRVSIATNLLSNIQENLGIKVNKNNFVEAVSVNGVLTYLNYDYKDNFIDKKYTRKNFIGSPIIAYVKNIHNIFNKENEKIEKIKDLKFKEINIPTLDEAQSTRIDLIENYTSKIAEYEKLKKERIENEIKNDLESYKFDFWINGENFDNLNSNINNFSNNKFNSNISNSNSSLFELEKELLKKEFEIIQNYQSNPENIEEYKDLSSLVKNISNLNKKNNLNEDSNKSIEEDSINKVDKILKKKKLQNKGYAFITFTTSDEAKYLYLQGKLGIKIKNKLCAIEPKFNKTHNSMDIERLIDLAKKDAIIIGKEEEIKSAEQKILNFESSLDEKLSEKEKELKQVIAAYRDLYSDPFKKHDSNNPLSKEEEERLKYSIKKLEENTGVNNYWILEEDRLDELRKIKDKRMTKTYLDWQLLKKGVIPNNVLKSFSESDDNKFNAKNVVDKNVQTNFSDKEKFELSFDTINKNVVLKNETGRISMHKISDKKKFIESYLGKDYLQTETHGFQKDKRDEKIFRDIRELRERFPKELFENEIYGKNSKTDIEKEILLENPNTKNSSLTINIENLIENINKKYINIINNAKDEKNDENEMTKVELLDRLTNLSPINKKIQLIVTERNRMLDNEEIKQSIAIKNFIDKTALREMDTNAKLVDHNSANIQYNLLQDIQYESSFYKKYWETDQRTFIDFNEEEFVEKKEQEPIEEPLEGDSSFAAFIARRKILLENKEKEEKDRKTQFDSEKICLDKIKEIQEDKKNKAFENIRLKYQMQMSSVILKNKNEFLQNEQYRDNKNNNNRKSLEDNVFEFLKNKKNASKEKLEKFNEKIKIERKKAEFIEQLEFLRDCWLNLKSEVTIVKKDQDPNDCLNVSISPSSSLSNSIIENVETTTSTIVVATTSSSLSSQNVVATTSDIAPKSIFKNNAKKPKETTVKLAPPNTFIDELADFGQSQGKGAPNKKSKVKTNHIALSKTTTTTRTTRKRKADTSELSTQPPTKKNNKLPADLIHLFFTNILVDINLITSKKILSEDALDFTYIWSNAEVDLYKNMKDNNYNFKEFFDEECIYALDTLYLNNCKN